MIDVETIDITDPALYADGVPHDVFTELRRRGPVHRHVTTRTHDGEPFEFWSVVGHPEIQHANRDWQTFSARHGAGLQPTDLDRQGVMIVSMDPPEHSRLRKLISAGFTPRMISELEGAIVRRTAQVLDAVAEHGACDFVRDVAYQLPMHVIADIVGIPDEDREWVFHRTEVVLRWTDPRAGFSKADRDLAQRDLFFLILALAGSETTRNAISQGLVALLGHPDQMNALRDDRSLLPSAADEMIRWASPVLYFGRLATCDVELGGASIRAGERVVLWYPSGNRDERVFAEPFRFDIRRHPNPHVSFGGGGPHYCLGASLARREVQVMFDALLDRFARIEPTAPPVWSGCGPAVNVGVSIDTMPVSLEVR